MTNTNCLDGLRCPKCGQEDQLKIVALITCVVTDEGSEAVGCHDWDQDSPTTCPECVFSGKLKDFRKLPPDPDGKNNDRALWASYAIDRFRNATGADECDAVCDLLANLMHWCDRNGQKFEDELLRGRCHYEAETATGEVA